MTDCNIRVICRFRPQNDREKQEALRATADHDVSIELTKQTATIVNGKANKSVFTLDHILPSATTQEEVYEAAAKPTVIDLLKGYNGTIFAYGQTGAGKSFTMFGPDIESQPKLRGIIPRSIGLIFDSILNDTSGSEFTIKCSFLEIYKESVHDLLNPKAGPLKVRETPARGTWVEDLTEEFVTSEKEVLDLIREGEKCRSVAYTKMNATSSRSHSLFTLILQQKSPDGSVKSGKLNLADLAGSEKVGKTGAVGETLDEAKKINQSLSALGNCINALTKQKRGHVPFRDSKLTFILRESLGGNSKTTLVVNCSPDKFNIDETLSTLQFAQRAKMIKNSVTINKQKSVEELNQIIIKLTKEIAQLKLYIQGLGHAVPKGLDAADGELQNQLSSSGSSQSNGNDGGADYDPENRIDREEHEQQLQALTDAKAQLEEFREMAQAERTTNAKQLFELQEQLSATTKNLELKATEGQQALEQLQLSEKKWEEEREQLKQQNEELRRQKEESARKLQILQEQQAETGTRFDSMIDDLKSQGNDAQAKLAEQLGEAEGRVRHRELIISELAEQLSEEQASKSQMQNTLDKAQTSLTNASETMQKQDRRVIELNASLSLAQQEANSQNQANERLVARVKRLEEQNATQNSEIQSLISRIQELNTPPSSPVPERAGNRGSGTKSRIVRPVAKKKEKSSASLTSSLWSLFSPTKIFQAEEITQTQSFELASYGGAKLILKQGWLNKQGMNNLRSWKRRHCVLRGDAMVYMGDGEHIKGSIALDAHAIVSPTDEFTFKKNSFGIFHPANPSHFFYADSADECSAWMEACLAVVEKAKQDRNFKVPAFPGGREGGDAEEDDT